MRRATITEADKFFRRVEPVGEVDRSAATDCMDGYFTKFGRKANGECFEEGFLERNTPRLTVGNSSL